MGLLQADRQTEAEGHLTSYTTAEVRRKSAHAALRTYIILPETM